MAPSATRHIVGTGDKYAHCTRVARRANKHEVARHSQSSWGRGRGRGGEGDARRLTLAPVRCRGPVVNCQRVHSHGDGRGESDARRRGRARRRPRRRRARTTHRSGCPSARRAPRLNRSSSETQPVVLSAPTSLCASRRRQRRVHSHLGDGGGEGDARRLTLALVRCRGPVVNCSSSAPLVLTWTS